MCGNPLAVFTLSVVIFYCTFHFIWSRSFVENRAPCSLVSSHSSLFACDMKLAQILCYHPVASY